MADVPLVNALGDAPSPYLRQHADNPVAWQRWGPEALAAARAADKPLLVSIGYAACHWCHVMAHESFEDPATAALMNERFVNVKVDREERPDVDAVYMEATQAMTGQGGWPMTVFCLPDGRPFYAGTYFPPAPRHGLPGFRDLLTAVAQAYAERGDEAAAQADQVLAAIDEQSRPPAEPGALSAALLDTAVERLVAAHDDRRGGFGGAPKFPPPMPLTFLLRRHLAGDARALAPVRRTLDAMAAGGMCDQLGGGFHRYSVDANWSVPHFEKMLYDNAQLARVYLRAHLVTGEAAYRRTAEATLDCLLADFRAADGAFVAAIDADSAGGEGAFYVFTPTDVRVALRGTAEVAGGPEGAAQLALAHYGITDEGNVEGGGTVLGVANPVDRLAVMAGVDEEAMRDSLGQIRRRLKTWRDRRREAPARVDTVIAAWNGLAIAAFAEAGFHLDRPDYVAAAAAAADACLTTLRAADGRLLHCALDGTAAAVAGFADDHGALADGLVSLFEATGERRWLDVATELGEALLARFAIDDGTGFASTADDAEPLVRRPSERTDNATPSGTSLACDALLRLAAQTGDDRYRAAAERVLGAAAAWYAAQPTSFGWALCAVDRLLAPARELAIVGVPEAPDLVAVARATWRPDLALAVGAADAADPPPLLAGRPAVDGRAAAYVCEHFSCRAPVTDPAALATTLTD